MTYFMTKPCPICRPAQLGFSSMLVKNPDYTNYDCGPLRRCERRRERYPHSDVQ